MRELLSRFSSRELVEMMVYERHAGPIGTRFQDEMLAQIHELLQYNNYLVGASMADKKNPNKVPAPKPVPRPWIPETMEEE